MVQPFSAQMRKRRGEIFPATGAIPGGLPVTLQRRQFSFWNHRLRHVANFVKPDELTIVNILRRSLTHLQLFANGRGRHPQLGIFKLNGHDQADQRRRHTTIQQQLRLSLFPDFCGGGEIMTEMRPDHADFMKLGNHTDFAALPKRTVGKWHALTICPA